MTWNEDRERIIAASELGDATPQVAVDLLVAARKRAFAAESAYAWSKTWGSIIMEMLSCLILFLRFAEGHILNTPKVIAM